MMKTAFKISINVVCACFAAIVLLACTDKKKDEKILIDTVAYHAEMDAWDQKRVKDLKAPDGWLNLVGLFWLHDGANSFGSDAKNDVVFPAPMPAHGGYFTVKQDVVTMDALPGLDVRVEGAGVRRMTLFHPDSIRSVRASYDSLVWNVIRRDDKLGIRLRNLAHPDVKNFKGIERFPVNVSWRLPARFEKTSGRTLEITNVLDQTTAQASPGTLIFEIDGVVHRLDVLEGSEKEFFVIFGDATNANETYGAGRYIYVAKPESGDNTLIDFNKAYNPPCAFTAYATCPLPPRQNVLPVAVTAGEKNYGKYERDNIVSHE